MTTTNTRKTTRTLKATPVYAVPTSWLEESADPKFKALKELKSHVNNLCNSYKRLAIKADLDELVEMWDELLDDAANAVDEASHKEAGAWPRRDDYPEGANGDTTFELDLATWEAKAESAFTSLWEKAKIAYAFYVAGLPKGLSFGKFAAMAKLDEDFCLAAMRELVVEAECYAHGVDIHAEWKKARVF